MKRKGRRARAKHKLELAFLRGHSMVWLDINVDVETTTIVQHGFILLSWITYLFVCVLLSLGIFLFIFVQRSVAQQKVGGQHTENFQSTQSQCETWIFLSVVMKILKICILNNFPKVHSAFARFDIVTANQKKKKIYRREVNALFYTYWQTLICNAWTTSERDRKLVSRLSENDVGEGNNHFILRWNVGASSNTQHTHRT